MRSDVIDISNQRFHRWLVIGSPVDGTSRKAKWLARCDCGVERYVFGDTLRNGSSKSCGCLHVEQLSKPHKVVNGVEHKHCFICKEWKGLQSFTKNKYGKDGLEAGCSACRKVKLAQYRKDHPKKRDEWARNNPEKARENTKKYRAENRDHYLEWCREYGNQPHIKIRSRMATLVRYSLKHGKGGKSWESLTGYNLSALKRHLEKTLPDGYTMDDLDKLHIDHIIPVSVFNIKDENSLDFKRCWDLSNLRLLPAEENLKKSDTLYKPFQPSLAIGLK